jgi:hypothetical protein
MPREWWRQFVGHTSKKSASEDLKGYKFHGVRAKIQRTSNGTWYVLVHKNDVKGVNKYLIPEMHVVDLPVPK